MLFSNQNYSQLSRIRTVEYVWQVESDACIKIIEIDWSDIDAYQHVNNLAYFKYAQSARVALCAKAGIATSSATDKPGFMLASSECQFKAPLSFPGTIKVKSRITEIGNTSFQISHQILDNAEAVVADLKDTLVLFDFSKNTKASISNELREKLNAFR